METRILGRAGISVSRIGLGLAALGRPGYITLGHRADLEADYGIAAMEARAHTVLDAAWRAGVRYFDAARSYGRAENFLGSWISARAPDPVAVGSKWGYTYTAAWKVEAERHEVKDHSLAVLRRQYAESRAALGHHLDLYQIHSATLESGVLEDGDVLGELVRLRRDSGIAIGLTLSGPAQPDTLRRAMDLEADGERVFDCVQATWNLLETSAGSQLRAAHQAGMGVIVKEVLANGRLTVRNTDPQFASRRRILERAASVLRHQAGKPVTLDAAAIAAALARPWIDVVLSGAASEAQLLSNLEATRIEWTAAAEALVEELREAPQAYWETRARQPWN